MRAATPRHRARGFVSLAESGYDRPVNEDVAGEVAQSDPGSGGTVPAPTLQVVARGVSWQALSVAFGQGCWYLSLFVLAILLPPHAFGVVAVGTVVASLTMLILESGTSGSLIITPDLAAASVRRSLVRTSVAGVLASVLLIVLARPIANVFTEGSDVGVLRVISLTVALAAVSIVPSALLTRHLRFKAAAGIAIASAAIASVAAIVAAVLGAGVWALAIRLVLSALMVAVLSWLAARDLLPGRARTKVRVPRRVGGPAFMMIAGAGALAWSCDNLVVGALTNPAKLGLYALAFSLAFLPLTQVSWAVGGVLLPTIAAARDEEVMRRQTLKAVRMMALLLLPLAPAAVALAPGLIPVLLGPKWHGMVVPFQILIVGGVGYGVLNVLGEALAGAGVRTVKLRAGIDVLWAIATIGAVAVGVTVEGIRGAAVAQLVTLVGLGAAYAWRGGHALGLSLAAVQGALAGVAGCVSVQALATAASTLGLEYFGVGALLAGLVGATTGVFALALALRLGGRGLLHEGHGVVVAALGRKHA